MSFVLGEDLTLRKLKFLDGAVDQLENTEHDDLRAELDARFALMSGEVKRPTPTTGLLVSDLTKAVCSS
ncbi:Recombination-associated protein RdgC [compost metagenome]